MDLADYACFDCCRCDSPTCKWSKKRCPGGSQEKPILVVLLVVTLVPASRCRSRQGWPNSCSALHRGVSSLATRSFDDIRLHHLRPTPPSTLHPAHHVRHVSSNANPPRRCRWFHEEHGPIHAKYEAGCHEESKQATGYSIEEGRQKRSRAICMWIAVMVRRERGLTLANRSC